MEGLQTSAPLTTPREGRGPLECWLGVRVWVAVRKPADPNGLKTFGLLSYASCFSTGSCGYTNGDGSLPFPPESMAALADRDKDFPGSCGRCYELRCVSGVVYGEGVSQGR